jgi:PAS domain S-box-containing protein
LHKRDTIGEGERAGNPRSNTGKPYSHAVQFYEDEAALLEKLGEFAGSTLGAGGSCLVIGSAEHRRRLTDRLQAWNFDVAGVMAAGRLLSLDADEMLKRFMVATRPDPPLFAAAIEPLLARAKSALRRPDAPVAAFGEMVALLWQQARYPAALQLEKLWNELIHRHAFSLLCAYPISCFMGESQHELFAQVCREHTQVFPTERYTSLNNEGERMRMVSGLQQRAAQVHSMLEERERAIAQRQYAEEKLWRSEEFARKVVESGSDCVKVLDLAGRLEYISPACKTALGADDLCTVLGREWVGFWREEDRFRVRAALDVARAGGVGCFQADSVTGKETRRFWDVRITPARGRDGQIERLIAVSRDLTELRQAQQIALQAEKVAVAGRMAATIAHEINNPLEAVTNFLFLARTTPGMPEEAARHLEIADRELTRVAQIAQKTLGFYRDTSRNKWVSISELVDDVTLIYDRKLRRKQMHLKLDVDPGLKVFAKQGELKQVLSNLLANAIDASSPHSTILLRAQASLKWTNGHEPGTRITVADYGTGMTPDVQKRIFMPFFTTKSDIGTGLGLWVTKSLIEHQGGYLHFRSRQGLHSGTVMSFFVPAAPHVEPGESLPNAA